MSNCFGNSVNCESACSGTSNLVVGIDDLTEKNEVVRQESNIVCPLCDAPTDYISDGLIHMWSCNECPGIIFEFVEEKDVTRLADLILRK